MSALSPTPRTWMKVARPRPVGARVVRERDLGAVVVAHQIDQRRRLIGVQRHDPQESAPARREVLVRLAGQAAGLVGCQTHIRAGRADLRNARAVQDRHRDLARARVELADVIDRLRVPCGLARVGGGPRRTPGPGLRCGIVQRDESDSELPRSAAGLGERELLAVDDRLRGPRGGPAQRHARVEVDRPAAASGTSSTTAAAPAQRPGDDGQ